MSFLKVSSGENQLWLKLQNTLESYKLIRKMVLIAALLNQTSPKSKSIHDWNTQADQQ